MDRHLSLIATLGLVAHPEGGYYSEVYRSPAVVKPADGRETRRALTTIYFLLPRGEVSRWHRVHSDEVWHFYEGAPLELWTTKDLSLIDRHRLGSVEPGQAPVAVVPAGCWQAARSTGGYTLVGCTVGPGFDFKDFTMATDDPNVAAALRKARAAPAELL
jgi:predicted cupin superfamily sugar epimerase